MNLAYLGQQTLLELQLDDGATNKYCRAYVMNVDGLLIQMYNLSPSGAYGSYVNYYTPTAIGYFKVAYKVFQDNLYTIADKYTITEDVFFVQDKTADVANIAKVVWNEDLSTHPTTNSAGKVVYAMPPVLAATATQSNLTTLINTINARLTDSRAAYLDNLPLLDAAISTRVTQTSFDTRLPSVRAALIDSLSLLDVAVSTRSTQVSVDNMSTTLFSRLTAQRAINLDNLDSPVSGQATNIAAIKTKTDQLAFSGGLISANALQVVDKTGYSLLSANIQAVVNAVWNEATANHVAGGSMGKAQTDATTTNPTQIADAVWDTMRNVHTGTGTFGEAHQGIVTIDRANRLDYLDVPVSSVGGGGGGGGGPIYIPGLTPERIANLDNLNDQITSRAAKTYVEQIKARTDLIPDVPAQESTVLARPTNPLLADDQRLATLDAHISTRATPTDLAGLAKETTTQSGFAAAMQRFNQVDAEIAPKATSADVTQATVGLATSTQVAALQSTVNTGIGQQIQPSDVWNYGPRTLSGPVDTTVDISGLATSAELAQAKADIVNQLTFWSPKLTVAINPRTDIMELMSWLEMGGLIVYDAESSSVQIYDKDDNIVLDIGPDMMASSHGVFSFTRPSASTLLRKNSTYTCRVTVVNNSITYNGFVPISVF